ncbi:Zinc-finger of the MIZ type in Nse subunit [Geosmithia morbida]|uniref:Zinc-finger of the MIZ type in Nse subunit n=1 Tax=Geosmithia morbida TaxID=1094350 RepID=A0A9P5D7C1_9HYPO|nr:Zinc-finger of the MIZ type in Nse subunit [Geosmithia morbida]KAF4125645.1 Zinc-finger of the MIZ type in Nse subunit [Geosmithia morbida]
MSRRLVNRARSSIPAASQSPAPTSAVQTVEYEPPSFPLTDAAAAKLGELSRNRETLAYQVQIKESLRQLALAVYDVNSRLLAERNRLEQMRTRRQDRGTDKLPEEDRLEAHVADLETQVDALSRRCEAATRSAIDQRAALEDEATLLGELYTTATTRRTQEPPEEQHGEDNEEQQQQPRYVPSTLESLREGASRKRREYDAMPHYQRYALDNDYISFKKLCHDGIAGDDGPPLPDASRWFRDDGTPILSTATNTNGHGAGAEGDGDDDDDDVAVAREVISLNCPLTLRLLEEPYSNKKCKHTFEKSAILDYLGNSTGPMQCPQTGCAEMFTRRNFNQDFYLDDVIMHRVQRAKQAQDADEMDVESEAGDEV